MPEVRHSGGASSPVVAPHERHWSAALPAMIRLFPATADANAKRLVLARGLRALADGYVSILLPAYLLAQLAQLGGRFVFF